MRPINSAIRPPGSKSITNRALVCAALAEGDSVLTGALDSEDTRVMIDCLGRLGVQVRHATDVQVTGCGGRIPSGRADLFVANSGTTIRFLTSLVALGDGSFRLDGVERMRQRPIGDLLEALQQLGVDAQSENANGCPPVIVTAHGIKGGEAEIRGNISSQYLSGILIVAPYAHQGVRLAVQGELVSKPYVDMTLGVMRSFGVAVESANHETYAIEPARYHGITYHIEPDASAASYFWGAAAVTSGKVKVLGLNRGSLQGDVAFCDCLKKMGCAVDYQRDGIVVTGRPLHGVEVNMNAISDTVQTLAAVALFADSPTTISGVGHIRHKETDRIGDLARELRKFGAEVDERDDGLRIVPPDSLRGASIDTYRDHRMAMSLSLVGLRQQGVVINDPGCTEKTYPQFFEDLESLRHEGLHSPASTESSNSSARRRR